MTRAFKRVKNKIRCIQVEKVFYYIPLLKTLQEQLKFKEILQMVFAENKTDTAAGYLEDFNMEFLCVTTLCFQLMKMH